MAIHPVAFKECKANSKLRNVYKRLPFTIPAFKIRGATWIDTLNRIGNVSAPVQNSSVFFATSNDKNQSLFR